MKTSVISREAWSQAARETARGFQTTRHSTGQHLEQLLRLCIINKQFKNVTERTEALGFVFLLRFVFNSLELNLSPNTFT